MSLLHGYGHDFLSDGMYLGPLVPCSNSAKFWTADTDLWDHHLRENGHRDVEMLLHSQRTHSFLGGPYIDPFFECNEALKERVGKVCHAFINMLVHSIVVCRNGLSVIRSKR